MQIILIDLVFSIDSVITAVGMVDELSIMIAAVVLSIGLMMFVAGRISEFVNKHPTVKILALSFLVLIGSTLVAESFDVHVDKPALGDLYVVCSDGLTGMVKDEEIEAIATSDEDLDVVCERLITTANKNGGLDNITVVAVRVEKG